MSRFGILAATAITTAALLSSGALSASDDQTPEAAWQEEVDAGNEAYAGRDRAILKIDDAVYLEEGQTAWLIRHEDERVHYLWTLEEPPEFVLSLSYDGETAMMRHINPESTAVIMDRLREAMGDNTSGASLQAVTEKDLFVHHEDNDSYEINDTVQMTAFPTQMRPGEYGLRATVFNQNHPEAEHFEGLLWYDYNPDMVIEARFEPMEEFVPETFQTSRGWYKEFQHVGHAVFSIDGTDLRMPLYGFTTDPAEIEDISAFFTDAMSGIETYGVGRYMDVSMEAGSFPPETVTLDFNYAYNPNCARSEYYNCPYAEFDIPVSVPAGEMIPEGH